MTKLFGILLVATLMVIQSQATTLFEEEVRIFHEIIGKDKDELHLIRPPGEPTNVTVNMYVRNFLSLNEETRLWKLQLTFRQEWTDSRLAYTTTHPELKYLPYNSDKNIWIPDLFFSDEVHSEHHDLITPNTLIRIFPDGHIIYSTRVTLELYCPNLHEHQKEVVCPIRIASYGYTKDELAIEWKDEEPVQLSKSTYLPNFHFNEVTTSHGESVTKTGAYASITADFKFGHGHTCHV